LLFDAGNLIVAAAYSVSRLQHRTARRLKNLLLKVAPAGSQSLIANGAQTRR